MFTWTCPACSMTLTADKQSWQCQNGHSFDRAKSGYINLLLPQHKSSKSPGDTKAMLMARKSFLDAEYYLPIAQKIAKIVNEQFEHTRFGSPLNMLDSGCGEGYYLQQIKSQLTGNWETAGLDISKDGIHLAAKRDKQSTWICASSARLPIADKNIDSLIRVFSPSNDDEMYRTLKDDGLLIIVGPGENHLIEIKKSLYDTLKPYNSINTPKNFIALDKQEINYQLVLEDNEAINSLLSMTPFFWKGNAKQREALLSKEKLSVQVNMNIYCYKKAHMV